MVWVTQPNTRTGSSASKRTGTISRQGFLHSLVNSLYNRSQEEFKRGTFRVKGDTVDINLPYVDFGYRVTFFGDEIEDIESIETSSRQRIGVMEMRPSFPPHFTSLRKT
jgi:excinuclease ABC subunit B